MKWATGAALAAALLLALAVSGVFARDPSIDPADPIRLGETTVTVAPSPSPTDSDSPERVERHVEEHEFDDKGGLRDRDREDNSGRGSGNSGRGSDNSGSDRSDDDDD